MSREIQAAAPAAELVIIPNAAHLANLEQPEAFTKIVAAFASELA